MFSRARAASSALLSLTLLALSGPAAIAVQPLAGAEDAVELASGPNIVEVPLESSLEVRPAAGWSFSDCGALREASDFVTQCAADGFTVTGPAYDHAIAPVRVSVPMRSASASLTVDYLIRLADPTPPDAPDTTIDLPLLPGAVSLIPLSDLGLDCGLCSEGVATIEVRKVEPESAGIARVTGSHLVFSAAPQAQGSAEVSLRVQDDLEHPSNTFIVTLHVSNAEHAPLVGLHLSRPAGAMTISAEELVFSPGEVDRNEALVLADCGPAMHGTVTCLPGGEVRYEPPRYASAEAPVADQFSLRLVAGDGRQALASVTLAASDAESVSAPLVPASGLTRAKLEMTLPEPPPEEDEAAASGVTKGFTELMDSLGAR